MKKLLTLSTEYIMQHTFELNTKKFINKILYSNANFFIRNFTFNTR